MPHLAEDWQEFEDYAEHIRIGVYQEMQGLDGIEVRVMAGRLAYYGLFDDINNPTYLQLKKFVKFKGFIKVTETVNEDTFFPHAPT